MYVVKQAFVTPTQRFLPGATLNAEDLEPATFDRMLEMGLIEAEAAPKDFDALFDVAQDPPPVPETVPAVPETAPAVPETAPIPPVPAPPVPPAPKPQ